MYMIIFKLKILLFFLAIRNRRLQLEAVCNVVRLLPVAHRDTLYVLLKFLAKVASASNDTKSSIDQTQISGNKMDSSNLATIIAPNILHCIKSDQLEEQEITERADVINIIRIMIDHYEDIFTVSLEDINDIYISMMDLYPQQLDYLLDHKFVQQE
jgi:Rho GTPase-activating protein 6